MSTIGAQNARKDIIAQTRSLIEEIREAEKESMELRKTLWLSHGCIALYGDDGEMQCQSCLIDFRRMTPAEIEARLTHLRRQHVQVG